MTKSERILAIILGVAVCGLGIGFLCKQINYVSKYNKYEHHGVPIIEVSLNGVSLEEIDENSKEIKYSDNALKLYNDWQIDEYEKVEIKGRGNGTWNQKKKPYQIKFDNKVDVLGLGKAKKWYLLANASDDTLLRNEIAFKLEEMLGMKYRFEGRYVELYVNTEYRGLYYLTHAVEISKNVVNLKDPMGVLVELDNFYWKEEGHYETNNGEFLSLKDIVSLDLKEPAMEGFVEAFNELEEAVQNNDYAAVARLIDERSFAEYYLLSEISVNPDAYWTSMYFYKDGPKDEIHAGPGWDFDMAFANPEWRNWLGDIFYSPRETMVRKREMQEENYVESTEGLNYETSLLLSQLMFDLMDMPEFKAEVNQVFKERIAGRRAELFSHIEKKREEIREIVKIDGERWEKDRFDEMTKRMLDWLEERLDYMEEEYGDNAIVNSII